MKKFLTASALIGTVALTALPVFAEGITTITVANENHAYVSNNVEVRASTGGNTADGGYGSSAGNGGPVMNSGSGNTGGMGGNGGNGGNGGIIGTGDATAAADITNRVNYNKTHVDPCACDTHGWTEVTVTVDNDNHAKVKNDVDVKAKTGYNQTNGGSAGSAGSAGGAVADSGNGNTGGNGGVAGNGGMGGGIISGWATSGVVIVNRVNTNITRVH